MNLKDKIQASFVAAMKAKDESSKSALSSLKSKITEAEKANGNKELDDNGVLKVLANAIKQRKQSIEAFAGRQDLVDKETSEMKVLETFMPSQMSDEEITEKVKEIMEGLTVTNRNQKVGMTIGAFNKKYTGQADPARVKSIIESLA
jgi:uncharacterized protein YqeY